MRLLVLFVTLAFLTGCGGKGLKKSGAFEDVEVMVQDAKTRIDEISVQDLKVMILKKEEFLLIDVREQDEFKRGHISEAINIPRGLLEFKIIDEQFWRKEGRRPPSKKTKIILYSERGRRSLLAADSLRMLGYRDVKSLEGEWRKWKEGLIEPKEEKERETYEIKRERGEKEKEIKEKESIEPKEEKEKETYEIKREMGEKEKEIKEKESIEPKEEKGKGQEEENSCTDP